ncbi:hypothetical protein B0H66DRAFT_543772 [Apodospora peruviana]|uniref:Uncharacterized protein n=1 Tax=Apodospora peruviana TaxID=516989 RepID=A0AAE0ISL1_9PEZI|nr:hypothetical protein B0H66DRAFT_543772 [Apodospora peruviana]
MTAGYTITHKGVLCWASRPSATLVPVTCLLFILLETTMAYGLREEITAWVTFASGTAPSLSTKVFMISLK